jgi:anaerobic ribonucleoside-triphosphate reductase activating protein
MCNVVVDGRYINELRDITLKWRGSKNQRVIDVKASFEQEKVVLWE